jgi:hypothetical protein
MQIHDVCAGGAGNNEVSKPLKKVIRIVVLQRFIQKLGAAFD